MGVVPKPIHTNIFYNLLILCGVIYDPIFIYLFYFSFVHKVQVFKKRNTKKHKNMYTVIYTIYIFDYLPMKIKFLSYIFILLTMLTILKLASVKKTFYMY